MIEHPFCEMVQALSGHAPERLQLPSTFAQVPDPPPPLLELQAKATVAVTSDPTSHLESRMGRAYSGRQPSPAASRARESPVPPPVGG